jgi:hypothetical protein
MLKKQFMAILFSTTIILAGLSILPPDLGAQEVIASGQVSVKGVTLQVDPLHQSVPLNTATSVNTILSVDQPQVLEGMVVKGTLRGPGLNSAVPLTTMPNHPFSIPGLSAKGTYTLGDIRLEKDGKVLLTAETPEAVIEVMDIIITSVETRPLTLEEIREKGINITNKNFTVYNFSVGIIVESQEVRYDFPVIYADGYPQLPSGGGGFSFAGLKGPISKEPVPFTMEIPDIALPAYDDGVRADPPRIPGILVFNNDIAFLNQFFSVMFIISNNSPEGSSLVLNNVTATIDLPAGLREAETTPPHVKGTPIPVHCPGPDGKIGTADDLDIILATFSGQAEFLAEGLQEGTHTVTVNFDGTLSGLPGGDVPVKGSAKGAVIVRNPEFSVTFAHPSVVRVGEQYDIHVTLTNTSPVDANLVSVILPKNNVIGAKLLTDESISFETIKPGQSETVRYHLESLVTGRVSATAMEMEGNLKGRFMLTVGVGEQGIVLSPDTLVLPDYAYALPQDVINTSLILLGEAYSIACTPAGGLPDHLPVISTHTVRERVIELAEAGQRVEYTAQADGTPDPAVLPSSLQVLTLDWLGNRNPDISFDILRRLTSKGINMAAALAAEFDKSLAQSTPGTFQLEFAQNCAYKEPFISGILSFDGDRKARMVVLDSLQNRLTLEDGEPVRNIAYSELFLMQDSQGNPVDFALIGKPDANGYSIEIHGESDGNFELSLVVPGTDDVLNQVTFPAVQCKAGSKSTMSFTGGDTSFTLTTDLGDGSASITDNGTVSAISMPPLTLLGAVQDCSADDAGHVVALLFNRPVAKDSAQQRQNYYSEGKRVYAAFLQPSERVVLVGLDNPVSPFVESTIGVRDIQDTGGGAISPNPVEIPVKATIKTNGGIVSGTVFSADGAPVANAKVMLEEHESGSSESVSVTYTDNEGKYQFDFVRLLYSPFQVQVQDPDTGKQETVSGKIQTHGQRFQLDIIMRGRGTVSGKVLQADGSPAAGATVRAKSDNAGLYEYYSAQCGDNGTFVLENVPVGRINFTAAKGLERGMASTSLNSPGDLRSVEILLFSHTTGSVSGRVFESDGITPVIGTIVTIFRVEDAATQYFLGQAESDGEGRFSFDDIPTGSIMVNAVDPKTYQYGRRIPAVVVEGETADMTIVLRGTATISGTVSNFAPAAAEKITVYIPGTNSYTQLNSDGTFTLSGIPLGNYNVYAHNGETYKTCWAATKTELYYEGQEAAVTLAFPDILTGSIQGQVSDPAGLPMAYADVMVYTGNYIIVATTSTDASGNYQAQELEPGNYGVVALTGGFAGAGLVQVSPLQTQTRDIAMRGKGSITIDVFASDGQSPIIADVKVRYPVFEFKRGNFIGFRSMERLMRTDDDEANIGHLELQDIAFGEYTVSASNPFYPEGASAKGALDAANPDAQVQLTMKPTGIINVTVFEPDGTTLAPGAKLMMKAGFLPEQTAYTGVEDRTNEYGIVLEEIGKFSYTLVPPGSFRILVTNQNDPYQVAKLGGSMPSVAVGDPAPEFDAQITLKGYRDVKVKVIRPDNGANTPVSLDGQSWVKLHNLEHPHESLRWPDTSGRAYKDSASGDIIFTKVSEGPFAVTVFEATNNLGGRGSGTVIYSASTQDPLDCTVPLEESGAIAGRVLASENNEGIVNAQILLYNNATGNSLGYYTANSGIDEQGNPDPNYKGYFTFTHVPLGTYRIEVLDPATGRNGTEYTTIDTDLQYREVDVRLEGRGTVRGVFYDGSGNVAVGLGISVKIESNDDPERYPFERYSTTDALGEFVFEDIGTGKFTVTATDPTTQLLATAEDTVDYEGHEVLVDLVGQPTASVRVKVLEADQTVTQQGAVVKIKAGSFSTSVNYNQADITDPEKYLTVLYVPLGNFTATATVDNNSGAASGNLEILNQEKKIDVVLGTLGAIHAVVKSGGVPAAANLTFSYSTKTLFYSTADGNYTFENVPMGAFYVEAKNSGGLSALYRGELTEAQPVQNIELNLEDAGTVTGTIVGEDGSTVVENVYITLTQGVRQQYYVSQAGDGTYTFNNVRVGTFVVDIEGANGSGRARQYAEITSDGQQLDLGALNLDTTVPTVTSISPTDDSAAVGISQNLVITFSKTMDDTDISLQNLKVTPASGLANNSSQLQWDIDKKILTITPPTGGWAGSMLYTVTVTTGVEDASGNPFSQSFTSTFSTLDNVAPAVISVTPADYASGVATGGDIIVTFNESLAAGFGSQNLEVYKGGYRYDYDIIDGTLVSGTVSANANNTVFTFTPANNGFLDENGAYWVRVSGAQDLLGNTQSPGFISQFTTIDTLAPVFSTLTPDDNSSVFEGTQVTVRATLEQQDTSAVHFFIDGQAVGSVSQPSNNTYFFYFDVPLLSSGAQAIFLEAVAVDRGGNQSERIGRNYAISQDTPPTVAITMQNPTEPTVQPGQLVDLDITAADLQEIQTISYTFHDGTDETTTTIYPNPSDNTLPNPPLQNLTRTVTIDVPPGMTPGSQMTVTADVVDTMTNHSADRLVLTVSGEVNTSEDVKIAAPSPGSLLFQGEELLLKATINRIADVQEVHFFENGQEVLYDEATSTLNTRRLTVQDGPGASVSYRVEVTYNDATQDIAYSTATVVDGDFLSNGTVISSINTAYDGPDKIIIIKDGAVTINGAHTFKHILVKEDAVLTHTPIDTQNSYNMELTLTGKIVVGPEAAIDVSGQGYPGGWRWSTAIGNYYGWLPTELTGLGLTGSQVRAGGSHGGSGGVVFSNHPIGAPFDSPYEPVYPGGGGGGGDTAWKTGIYWGGNGGGALMLDVPELIVDGFIRTNGNGSANWGAGGAGGSIWLKTPTINGSGTIEANGGDSYHSGGGGGGRIAVYYDNASFDIENSIFAYGGKHEEYMTTKPERSASAGTIYLKQGDNQGRLKVNNRNNPSSASTPLGNDPDALASVENTVITLTGNVQFSDLTLYNSTLTLDGTVDVNQLLLREGSVIAHSPTVKDTTHSLYIKSVDLDMDSTSRIDVTGMGYAGANQPDRGWTWAGSGEFSVTHPNTRTGGSNYYSGGSHGGTGGFTHFSVHSGKTYGSYSQPDTPGSGGGATNSYVAQGGGGVIRIETDTLTMDDSIIRANGDNADGYGGAGAGGSIWITATTIQGAGVIEANGGTGWAVNGAGGSGGGGGRVAVHTDQPFTSSDFTITAYGGAKPSDTNEDERIKRSAGAGTVYLKTTNQTAQLIIDNNGQDSYLPLIFPELPPGAVTAVNTGGGDGKTISDPSWSFIPGSLVDMKLQVTHTDGGGTTVTDYIITDNDSAGITVDLAGIQVGDTFKGIAVLDGELLIRNTRAKISRDVEVGSLTLENNTVLSHPACTVSTENYLAITATGAVSIDATSRIDVIDLGYLGGYRKDYLGSTNSSQYGRTLNNAQGSYYRSGASHGGKGGQMSTYNVNTVYGSYSDPIYPGSGAGAFDSGKPGANGGGAVRITADSLQLLGDILADGGNNPDVLVNGQQVYTGGAGGSVNLRVNTFTGSGAISANGSYGHYYIASGGGGRIAIYYDGAASQLDQLTISAHGNTSLYYTTNDKHRGGAGTIFYKDNAASAGRLIIDNNGYVTLEYSTVIPAEPGNVMDLLELVLKGKALVQTTNSVTLPTGVSAQVEAGCKLEAANIQIDNQ